jgi:hypothetical protein
MAAVAGKSAGPESVVLAQGGSLLGDSQLAVHSQSAGLCTPDAVRSGAQSSAAQEAQAEQALAVQPIVSRWAEPQMSAAVEPVQSEEELQSSALSAACLQLEHSVLVQLAESLHVVARCSAEAPARSQLA